MNLNNDQIRRMAISLKVELNREGLDFTLDELSAKIAEASQTNDSLPDIQKEVYQYFKTGHEDDYDGDHLFSMESLKEVLGFDPDSEDGPNVEFHVINNKEELEELFNHIMNNDGEGPRVVGAAIPIPEDDAAKIKDVFERLKKTPQYYALKNTGMSDTDIEGMVEQSIKDNADRVANVNAMKDYLCNWIMHDMNLTIKFHQAFTVLHDDDHEFLHAYENFSNTALREGIPSNEDLSVDDLDQTDYIANMVFIAINRAIEIGFDIGQTLLDQINNGKPKADIPMPMLVTTPISCNLTFTYKDNIEKFGEYRIKRANQTLRTFGLISDIDKPYIDILTPYIKARINGEDDFVKFANYMQSLSNRIRMAMMSMANSEDFR